MSSGKKEKNNVAKAKRVGSDQPTALIAPSDYEHIFENQDENEGTKKVAAKSSKQKVKKQQPPKAGPSGNVKRVGSDQPTALIAPSDYEHIFENQEETKGPSNVKKVSDKSAVRLPSDTPTALLAPSDFEHIYRDPTVSGPKRTTKVKKVSRTSLVKQSGSNPSRSSSNQQISAQEVLPVSIQKVVKKFVEKQKKSYTINK